MPIDYYKETAMAQTSPFALDIGEYPGTVAKRREAHARNVRY